jgi:hypothetical protein
MAQRHGTHRSVNHLHSSRPRPSGVIAESMLSQWDVNNQGWEAVRWDLYDSIAYAAAGQTQLSFFTSITSKTISDTNLELPGQMPSMQKFLVDSVEVDFQPTVPAVTAQNPAVFGAQAAASIVNDVYIFRRTGYLQFNIGSKYYLQSGPMKKFPSATHFAIDAALADATTAAPASQSRIAFADVVGRMYHMTPYSVLLISNQNFNVTLNWPEGVQALPSTNPARVVVSLWGILYRRSQ